jgi:L-phenylalanine/L-methionine N-acetyltransferase
MLRSVTENDFNYIFELYMHPAINSFLMYEEMDASAFRPIFDQLLQQEVLWIMEVDNKQVGMIKLALGVLPYTLIIKAKDGAYK